MRERKPVPLHSVFNSLETVSPAFYDGGLKYVVCRCICGNEKAYLVNNVKRGIAKSCGCARKKHGMVDTPEYRAWAKARDRCVNSRNSRFEHYGGRGISMCQEWMDSFESFFSHMGFRPSEKHSLDREDNDKGYEPGNCRWALRKVQDNNRQDTRYLTFNGQTKPMGVWASELGIKYMVLYRRIACGWTVEQALTHL